jgi:chorismate lyase/3-hydroxybenzoate synthase
MADLSPTLLTVQFGAMQARGQIDSTGLLLELPLPVLAGSPREVHLVPGGTIATCDDGFTLRGPQVTAGFLLRPTTPSTLEEDAKNIFTQILAAVTGQTLYRVWNYVPQINDTTDVLENYHRFNMGRWRAYAETFGATVDQRMPAASAVGLAGSTLVTVFLAGSDPVEYFENPEQTPAYKYPERYGPKSPSFSRASLRARPEGSQPFLSGTSSIKGHETIGAGQVDLQTEVTCDNIRLVYATMAKPDPFGPNAEPSQAKVYLRKESDLDSVRSALAKCRATDFAQRATYLKSDICRPDLDVEIEITGI